MLDSIFKWVLTCGITVSLLTVVYLVFIRTLQKRIPSKWIYYIGVILLIIAFLPILLLKADNAFNSIEIFNFGGNMSNSSTYMGTSTRIYTSTIATILDSIFNMAKYGWLMGSITVLVAGLLRHHRFQQTVNRWSEPIQNEIVINTLHRIRKELGIEKQLEIHCCPFVISPLLIGLMKPIILLPQLEYSESELCFILKHECIHYKRKDLMIQYLLLFMKGVQWFNPFIYSFAREISLLGEISCDAQVIEKYDNLERQQYLESIITIIRKNTYRCNTPFSSNYYGGKKGMERRILSVMDGNKKKVSSIMGVSVFIIVGLIIAVTVYCSPFLNINYSGNKSSLEFISSSNTVAGFQKEATIYVDKNTTDVNMKGKVSVDGTATLQLLSDIDNAVVYTETFSSVKNKNVSIDLQGLQSGSSYTLTFRSEDANTGKLRLESDQSLTKELDKPERPNHGRKS